MKNQKKNINIKTLALILFLALQFTACGSKKIISTNNENYPPKLIFLNYNIDKFENGKKSIRFINKIITDGKLKHNQYQENGTLGDLECNQLDKNSNILQRIVLKNPLVKVIEYIDETKNFKVKKVTLSSTEFSLRLKLEPNAKYVTINEISYPNSKVKFLLKTEIN